MAVHRAFPAGSGLHALRLLREYLRRNRPELVINAAGYTGKPNVDACEAARAETLLGNTLLPQTIAHACAAAGNPWGHVSSGCIYSGAKVEVDGRLRVESDLTRPELRAFADESPERSTASRKRTSRISRFIIRRAVFTAAPRRWVKKPLRESAGATSGACAFPLTSSTARGIT